MAVYASAGEGGATIGLSSASAITTQSVPHACVFVGWFIIFLFGCAICWRSKLQPITATSTHEAELIACASASQEIIWCRKLLQDLGFALNLTPVKLSDTNRIRECLEDDGIAVSDEQYHLYPLWLFNDKLGTTQTIISS